MYDIGPVRQNPTRWALMCCIMVWLLHNLEEACMTSDFSPHGAIGCRSCPVGRGYCLHSGTPRKECERVHEWMSTDTLFQASFSHHKADEGFPNMSNVMLNFSHTIVLQANGGKALAPQ